MLILRSVRNATEAAMCVNSHRWYWLELYAAVSNRVRRHIPPSSPTVYPQHQRDGRFTKRPYENHCDSHTTHLHRAVNVPCRDAS